MQIKHIFAAILILLVGAGLRLNSLVYGLNHICLTPSAERWLYNPEQVSSLYTWNYAPNDFAETEMSLEPGTRAFLSGRTELLWGRFAGVLAGLLTIALTMSIGKTLHSSLWWLAGVAVAVSPWFVNADRWVLQFDFSTLLVALNIWLLLYLYHKILLARYSLVSWLHPISALLLLLVAPSLWWVTILLLALAPKPQWSKLLFLVLSGLILFPTLRNFWEWWNGAKTWDLGTTSTCIWSVIMLSLWYWRNPAASIRRALATLTVLLGIYSAGEQALLPHPTSDEWELVNYLRDHIPDHAVVYFDEKTWPLHPVVACPLDTHITYDARPIPVEIPINLDPRIQPPPDYVVSTDRESLPEDSFNQQVANRYWIGRTHFLVNPSDQSFGQQFRLLDYEILTPMIAPGEFIDIRLSGQYTSQVDVRILNYSLFVQVTEPDQPSEKLINFNRGLVDSFGSPIKRHLNGNYHLYIDSPIDSPVGTYDVIFGVFDNSSGQLVNSIMLGQITIEEKFQ